jgi:DNA repair photolyase
MLGAVHVTVTTVKNVLTRTTGFLKTVASHSLQPYRGCSYAGSLCGTGCYVQHNAQLLGGREWGEFLDVRDNAAESYRENVERERRWAEKKGGRFSVFMSSATDPFVAQEFRFGVTERVMRAMLEAPPAALIIQTHSHRVVEYLDLCRGLAERTELRVHLSIETDIERFPGLPPHASTIRTRFEAARQLRGAGIRTVITVAPLLPIERPERFFAAVADCADAVIIDHFIGGDGTATGSRTKRTPLPLAMSAVVPGSVELAYRDRMVEVAQKLMPGRVGVGADGFAGRFT